MRLQTSSMPVPSRLEHARARGRHFGETGVMKCSTCSSSARVASARERLSPSAFVTSSESARSMMPFLMPCSSSPAPAIVMTRKKSTIERTVVSLCPTPTVSTSTTSKPAASHSRMLSRVFRATPPSAQPEGDGRTKAFSRRESSSMRVLSPRMLPREMLLLGSIASTATRLPRSHRRQPNASMNVLLPPPGTPVTPTRTDFPACGSSPCTTASASSRCFGASLSTSVIARASVTRSPLSTPST